MKATDRKRLIMIFFAQLSFSFNQRYLKIPSHTENIPQYNHSYFCLIAYFELVNHHLVVKAILLDFIFNL